MRERKTRTLFHWQNEREKDTTLSYWQNEREKDTNSFYWQNEREKDTNSFLLAERERERHERGGGEEKRYFEFQSSVNRTGSPQAEKRVRVEEQSKREI